jgi:hypothetical protein
MVFGRFFIAFKRYFLFLLRVIFLIVSTLFPLCMLGNRVDHEWKHKIKYCKQSKRNKKIKDKGR